ncbi:MAG: C40 family peptidase [Desulfobacterales bacterium]|nr:C40 family peptidase [Desulfobacterales bacterium]
MKVMLRLRSIVLLLCLLFNLQVMGFDALAAGSRSSQSKSKTSSAPLLSEDDLLEEIKQYLGIPYRRGGYSKKGMDCSGLIKHIYSKTLQVDLPHSSSQQYALPTMEEVSEDELRPGDLIFFSQKKKRINHVGLYLSDGKFIHAGRKSGVTISSLDNRYWKVKMVGARRLAGIGMSKDTESEPSASRVVIALNENGDFLHPYPVNMTGFNRSQQDSLSPILYQNLYSGNSLTHSLSHSFELQISRVLVEDSWNMSLSLLREDLYTGPSEGGYLPQTLLSASHSSDPEYILQGYRHGVKMASDINPFEWLRITPSLSYLEYGNQPKDLASWKPALGLEIQVMPILKNWAFSAGFQYSDETQYAGKGLSTIDDSHNTNMSLMFGYRLKDDIKFNLVGQHALGNLFGTKQNYSGETQERKGLFFSLDWSF